jgi:hypothetical protein
MNTYFITQHEIAEKQQSIRQGYLQSQRAMTIAGLRQILGNTIIAFGTRLHGAAEAHREEMAEGRIARELRGVS